MLRRDDCPAIDAEGSAHSQDALVTEPARYSIRTPEDDVRRVAAMPEEAQRAVEEFVEQHLKTTPTGRIRRRLKMLTGEQWAGHYQFDVDRNHRLIYTWTRRLNL